MPSNNHSKNKNAKSQDVDFLEIFKAVFSILFLIGLVWFAKWAYFDVYKPEEKRYIRNSKYAYKIIQEELTAYYRKNSIVYDGTPQVTDKFCEVIRQKYSPLKGSCREGNIVGAEANIVFKKDNISIYGFERPAYEDMGTWVKDIIIDVDGEKGENTFGVDRVPIRIHSSGRLGGMLTPVNCKREDSHEYGIPYGKICPAGIDINFMDSKIPISYSVMQVGGKDGKSRRLNKNISYLRADCIAFGAEIFGALEYCDRRAYHWLTACYHEYYCAIEMFDE